MRQKVRALEIAIQAREAMIVSAYHATADAPPNAVAWRWRHPNTPGDSWIVQKFRVENPEGLEVQALYAHLDCRVRAIGK